MIVTLIAACEVAFWAAVLLGLTLRYPLRRPRAGLAVLSSVILIDVVLLVAVAIHLRSGGTASLAHSVATFYLGFSLAYGHRMIAWADVRFAHRFAGGPAPQRLAGAAYTRQCWGDVGRTGFACALAAAITAALIAWIADPTRTAALEGGYRWATLVFSVELLCAIGYTIWPRKSVPAAA